jgi:hypothetical protein
MDINVSSSTNNSKEDSQSLLWLKEMPYVKLYQELVDTGTELLLSRLKTYRREVYKLVEEVKDRLKIYKAVYDKNGPASSRVVGVDAGRNGTEYKFAYIPLYGAIAVLVENWGIVDEPLCVTGPPDIWTSELDPDRRESLLHMALEYHVAARAVEKWKPDYLLLDGGIVLNPKLYPGFQASPQYEGDFYFTVITVLELLNTCRMLQVPVLGFVKRTHMNFYSSSMRNSQIRDSTLMNFILKDGEYSEPFRVENVVTESYRTVAENLRYGGDLPVIYSSYIKTGSTPFRVEVPMFCLNKLEELMSIVYTMASFDGVPYPIHEADRLSRITRPTSNIHSLVLYSKALELVESGEMELKDLDLLLLEYGESWTLNGNLEDFRGGDV